MSNRTVIHVLGHLLIFLAFILCIPAIVAHMLDAPADFHAFLKAAFCSLIVGVLFRLNTSKHNLKFSVKEGFAIVTFGWVLLSFFGSLPYIFTHIEGYQFNLTDAFFETMSGLTTTGASIIPKVENLPKGLLLWRSLTHWIGGMGVIVLFLAILPALGAGGFQLFRAEIPGPSKDKLSPKIANTAKTLWGLYFLLTILCGFSLSLAGMSIFDSVCHAFGTIATGGFSTHSESIGGYNNWQYNAIITIFMFLSGCNFILFIQLIKGRIGVIYHNEELRLYIVMITGSIAIISAMLYYDGAYTGSITNILNHTCFQVVCIITSTGYATTDYDMWPLACQFILILLMFTGACAGSTGGGIKVFRVLIALKIAQREIRQLLHPRAVLPLNIDGESISEALLRVILGFVSIFILLLGFFIFILAFIEGDRFNLTSLFSICVSCLSNIGPGLDQFGPTDNYAKLHDSSKWILSFMMLLGRLELYSVLVIFKKDIWTH